MIPLLEQQHVDRRPHDGEPRRVSVRSWDRPAPAAQAPARRLPPPPGGRRGSERLDQLMRHQSLGRPTRRLPHRRPARAHAPPPRREPGVAPRAAIRVRRPGRLALALGGLWAEVVAYLRESWKVWSVILGSGVGLLAMLAVLARFAPERVPEIALASAQTAGSMLREAIIAEEPASDAPLDPAVVRILAVREHVVTSGETLSEIAGKYGLRLGTLIDFNGITSARSIAVGRKLSVPNADGVRYTVRRGDSLSKIADRYGVTLNALRDWNDLQGDVIKSGQLLFIPGASLSEDSINRVLGKLFIYPTRGEFTSGFGMRVSPITRVQTFHNGIDLANRTGTPVTASRAGKVTWVDVNPTYGRVIIVSHTGGYQTMYAHLDTFLVSRGQQVAQGQQLGTMGSTGQSVGPHLHFTVFRGGVPIDPFTVLH